MLTYKSLNMLKVNYDVVNSSNKLQISSTKAVILYKVVNYELIFEF